MPGQCRRWRGLFSAAGFLGFAGAAGLCTGPAQAAWASSRGAAEDGGSGVSLEVSGLYSVSVVPGTWAPVAVSVTNGGASDVQGEVVLRSSISQLVEPGSQVCYSTGAGATVCSGGAGLYGGFSTTYSSGPAKTSVTYRLPLDMAPGTTKQEVTDVLAGPPESIVDAEVVNGSGKVLARATDQLAVEQGTVQPAVLVVTNDPTTVSSLQLPMPGGQQPQEQLLAPADLPSSSAALGAFAAIVVDGADTSALSPAQGRAIEGYVQAGGALVIAGGIGWRGDVAGLPAGLLPAHAAGTTSQSLLELGRLTGVAAPHGPAVVDELVPAAGSVTTLALGRYPLVVEAQRGSGQVVVSAVDPAGAPLSTWPGDAAFTCRLLASAFQYLYYSEAGVVNPGGSVISTFPAVSGVAGEHSGLSTMMSPAVASTALGGYLEQMPGASLPSAAFLGLLLGGYIVVAGPVCFFVLARLRRRELAWVALPVLAVVVGAVAYSTGAGMDRSPLADEVQVAQLAPGSNLAQVSDLGAVYLPRGGSSEVTLASTGPVSDLGAEAGGDLTVRPGAGPGTSALTVAGPSNSLGGWAESEDATLPGTLEASVRDSGGEVSGRVVNDLGAELTNVYVVEAYVEATDIGDMRPGASANFRLVVPSQQAGVVGGGVVPLVGNPFLSPANRGGFAAARQQAALQGLSELASEYSGATSGPVLMGLTSKPLLPTVRGGAESPGSTVDAVVVPLEPTAVAGTDVSALSPELVGSRAATRGAAAGLATTSSFVLAKGGSLDFQYLLPGRDWHQLRLELGSPTGQSSSGFAGPVAGVGVSSGLGSPSSSSSAGAGVFSLSAFNYAKQAWAPLEVSFSSGDIDSTIPQPAEYLSPGGALEARLQSAVNGLDVLGSVPTLSASPAGR